MDQIKTGKFIAQCRKEKNMTQKELAEKLGVTDKSISNWENARCLPDLSLFKPLCDELGISINELMSGERIKEEEYQQKLEENFIDTIAYTSKQIEKREWNKGVFMLIGGVLMIYLGYLYFGTFLWGLGVLISGVGLYMVLEYHEKWRRIGFSLLFTILIIVTSFFVDAIQVKNSQKTPLLSYGTIIHDDCILYETPLYNFYKIHEGSVNEYDIFDSEKQYTWETLPLSPFNRNKSGIKKLMQFQSDYVGDNSNDAALIASLPLSEHGFVFEIDELTLIIDYHVTAWYIQEDLYLERSLLYNSVSIFSLIGNVEKIQYNFTVNSYEVTRNEIEENYPHYMKIYDGNLHEEGFDQYLEKRLLQDDFVEKTFDAVFR